jgi:dihydrofolate reductase
MPRIVGHGLSVSLDGFMAGPEQSRESPLGVGGERLHEWAFTTKCMRELHGLEGGEEGPDNDWARLSLARIGATVMGRNMFGPIRGPWADSEWSGWWGNNPPFHHPVFVLTHHPRPSLIMEGGTTFHFVTDGIHEALERATEAAGDLDIRIGGGASTIQQYLDARLIEELHVAVVPTLLGGGEKLFDPTLSELPEAYECVRAEGTGRALHVLLARRGEE